jgi:RNase H-fold protein (predicted Holliday junction resolvase)
MANKLKKTCNKEELLDEISAKNILKDWYNIWII